MLSLKLLLTPTLIVVATLVQRRWGTRAGGVLVGLPLTAGPLTLFLALEQGPAFAAASAEGSLLGLVSLVAFCGGYAATAPRHGWPVATAAGVAAFTAAATLLAPVALPGWGAFALALATLAVAAARLAPAGAAPEAAEARGSGPRGELAWRALSATVVVIVLTRAALVLGPRVSGILAPFPVFVGTLAAFTHRDQGARAARRLLAGVLDGSRGYAVFFLVVAALLEPLGVPAAFALAVLGAGATRALAAAPPVRRRAPGA